MPVSIQLDERELEEFCVKWTVRGLSLYGSYLRGGFGPDSDIDLLVSFDPSANWSLFDVMEMEEELSDLVGRRVHLLSRAAVEESDNWIRRREILGAAQPIYGKG